MPQTELAFLSQGGPLPLPLLTRAPPCLTSPSSPTCFPSVPSAGSDGQVASPVPSEQGNLGE